MAESNEIRLFAYREAPDMSEKHDILLLEDVSSRDLAPQELPTVSTLAHDDECSFSLLHGFEDCSLSNICESTSVNDATLPGKTIKSRKRPCNVTKWKSRAAKRGKNSGQSGVSLRSKELKSRVMGHGCEKTCRFKCHDKITEEQRQTVFNAFWTLSDHARQWVYIARLMVPKNRKEEEKGVEKSAKRYYTLPVNQDAIKVCRSMFTGTLGISEQWIRTVKRKQRTSSGTSITPDLRGRHSNRPNRIPEAITRSVTDHIDTFPRLESHYCGESTEAQYLEQGLNLSTMYRLYKDWMRSKNEDNIATEHHYRHIFNNSYNLRFHVSKKDFVRRRKSSYGTGIPETSRKETDCRKIKE